MTEQAHYKLNSVSAWARTNMSGCSAPNRFSACARSALGLFDPRSSNRSSIASMLAFTEKRKCSKIPIISSGYVSFRLICFYLVNTNKPLINLQSKQTLNYECWLRWLVHLINLIIEFHQLWIAWTCVSDGYLPSSYIWTTSFIPPCPLVLLPKVYSKATVGLGVSSRPVTSSPFLYLYLEI